jgi:integrase
LTVGLRWDDVDLEAATVTIRQQRTIAEGSVVEGPPKDERWWRTIALVESMVAALQTWRSCKNEERLAMGGGW